MFGFGLKSKTKRILREEFFYEVSYVYKSVFNNMYQQGKMLGENEYSIAIQYMIVMMSVLVEDQKVAKGDRIDQFIKKHISNINRIIHQANSPEADIRNLLEEVIKNLEYIEESSEDKDTLKETSFEEISEEGNSENRFEVGDEDRLKLLHTMQQFTAFIPIAEFFFRNAMEEKNVKITNAEISVIRSFQLIGALDCVGQVSGWTMEQLIEPFITIIKEKPFEIDNRKAAKIIEIMSNPTPEIIEIQINGAHVFEKIMNIMTEEKFKDGMLTVAIENASELSNLTSQNLLNTIKAIST